MQPLKIPWFQKAKLEGMNRIIEQNEEIIATLKDIRDDIHESNNNCKQEICKVS